MSGAQALSSELPTPLPPAPPPADSSEESTATSDKAEDAPSRDSKPSEDGRRTTPHKKPRGDTPLHAACSGGHPSVVKQLIESGANVNSHSNSDGFSPAMRAIEAGNEAPTDRQFACVKLLVEHGCDLQQANFAGNVVLHLALENKRDIVADYLIAKGAKGCNINGRKCTKCAMGVKLRSRAMARQPKEVAPIKEDTAKVLEEEFGDGDFLKALDLAKEEMRRERG